MPVERMNSSATVERLRLGLLVRADTVLDALDALDLPLDVCTEATRLLDDLLGLALVLLDRKRRPVEEHGVPAGLQAFRDHLALGAVVKVKGDRDFDPGGHRAPHLEKHVSPDGSHRLHRRLHDHRRAEVDRGRKHRLERQVVDDVEGCDAVAVLERTVEHVLQCDDRHAEPPRVAAA